MIWIFLATLLLPITPTEIVCSEDELFKELLEDLEDDCKRKELSQKFDQYGLYTNSNDAANWEGDCAFESENKKGQVWVENMKKIYNINYLIDVTGEKYAEGDKDHHSKSDEADMCEFVRTLIFHKYPQLASKGYIEDDHTDIKMGKMRWPIKRYLWELNCAGQEPGTKICAINTDPNEEGNDWWIWMGLNNIQIDDYPRFEFKRDM